MAQSVERQTFGDGSHRRRFESRRPLKHLYGLDINGWAGLVTRAYGLDPSTPSRGGPIKKCLGWNTVPIEYIQMSMVSKKKIILVVTFHVIWASNRITYRGFHHYNIRLMSKSQSTDAIGTVLYLSWSYA